MTSKSWAADAENTADSFAADYAQARTLFRHWAREAGGRLDAVSHPEPGPDGSELSCDTAWFGPVEAERVLVLISGTHGVEGFCGSGAQVDLLRRGLAARLPPGVAVLMIHAINPWGFAWLSRVTHENVDLNRNWIDFSQPRPENPGYDALSGAVCPEVWTAESMAELGRAVTALGRRMGAAAAERSLTRGQYSHADGIYYGGSTPTWSRRTQTELLQRHLGRARRVAIIDYHTGLGPRGYAEQILTERPETAAFQRARAWFGAAVSSVYLPGAASAEIEGDGLNAAPALAPHAEVTALALEVGTLPGERVIEAVIADNWLRARGDVNSPLGQSIKARMRSAFYCDADDWRGMVAGQSLLACRQALAGLMSDGP